MMLFETRMFLVSLCSMAFDVNYAALSEESCYRFRGKANVTIDTDQCLWENYTEPKMKIVCLECCLQNASVSSSETGHITIINSTLLTQTISTMSSK